MNIQRFRNNEVRKIVCGLLGKSENEPIYTEEVLGIDRLSINPRIFENPTLEVDLGDLYLFKNLKSLYIRDIIITDYHIQCFNQVPSLNYLQLNKCKFEKLGWSLHLPNLEGLSIVGSYNLNMKNIVELPNLKILRVVGTTVEKYKGLEYLQSLEEVHFNNLENIKLASFLKLENLKLLNLDGSTVKKPKHEKLLSERLKVEHVSEYIIV